MDRISIRELKINEISESLRVLFLSFGRPIPLDIKSQEKLLNDLITNEIAQFLIARHKGKIIGLCGLFLFQEVCSFGYMSVLPEYRNKGIGTRIFSQLMEIAKKEKCNTFLLYASKLGEPLYKKYGFQAQYYTTRYNLIEHLSVRNLNSKNVKNLKKIPEWVINIDKKTMGFDRAEYLAIRLNHGSKLMVIEEEGYGFLSGTRLGPLISTNLGTALDLMKECNILGTSHLIIPKHEHLSPKICNWLEIPSRKEVNLRMTYGKALKTCDDYFYALGTYAKG